MMLQAKEAKIKGRVSPIAPGLGTYGRSILWDWQYVIDPKNRSIGAVVKTWLRHEQTHRHTDRHTVSLYISDGTSHQVYSKSTAFFPLSKFYEVTPGPTGHLRINIIQYLFIYLYFHMYVVIIFP